MRILFNGASRLSSGREFLLPFFNIGEMFVKLITGSFGSLAFLIAGAIFFSKEFGDRKLCSKVAKYPQGSSILIVDIFAVLKFILS